MNKTWLTRGFRPPYSISEAGSKLQIPYKITNVERVNVPWWKPVAGPRPATGHAEWGEGSQLWKIFEGWEYRVGG